MDILHVVSLSDDGFVCKECGIPIPVDVATQSDEVVTIGGAGVHWLPAWAFEGKVKRCTAAKTAAKAVIVCTACSGAGCEHCEWTGVTTDEGTAVETSAAKPARGETIDVAPRKTEVEKMVQRATFANFVAMREQTRPE